jgi:hypothetical protein
MIPSLDAFSVVWFFLHRCYDGHQSRKRNSSYKLKVKHFSDGAKELNTLKVYVVKLANRLCCVLVGKDAFCGRLYFRGG